MNSIHYVNGAVVSATDVRKSWAKIVQEMKQSHRPAFVFTNNTPEVVVMNFEDYRVMQAELEMARKEQLGRNMAASLIDIAHLHGEAIPVMKADENGIFRMVKD